MRRGPKFSVIAPLIALTSLVLPSGSRAQTPTELVVRVLSHDAKIIGSGVGGVRVTIRDAETGEILSQGIQEGGTGDTDLIMRTPWERGTPDLDTEGAAQFRASLVLDRPTRVSVEAEGPLNSPPEGRHRASRTLLLIPGEDIVGDGFVLQLNGFTVEILEPAAEAQWTGLVRARLTMLCGCPTEPGGLWDADRIRIWAEYRTESGETRRVDLQFTGETSEYSGRFGGMADGAPPGTLSVFASDTGRANTGMATLDRSGG